MTKNSIKKFVFFMLSYFGIIFLVMLIDRFALVKQYGSFSLPDYLILLPGNITAISIFSYILIFLVLERPYFGVFKHFFKLKLMPTLFSLAAAIGIQILSMLLYYIFNINSSGLSIGLACFLAPFVEEIFFREMIYDLFTGKAAVIVPSVLFALCHMNPHSVLVYLVFGFVLTLIRKKWNVAYCIIAHLAANTIAFTYPLIFS